MADTIDGANLFTSFDYLVERTSGFMDPPEASREEITVAREYGARSRSNRVNGRGFAVNGHIISADYATAIVKYKQLKSLVMRAVGGTADIRLDDVSGYKVLGEYVSISAEPHQPQRQARGWRCDMQFRALRPPAFVKITDSTISNITTSDVDIPMGSAPPIDAVLAILEPTDPTVTLKDYNGNTIATMVFTFTPGTGEYLVIDISKGEIYRNLTGVPGGTEASSTVNQGTTWVRFNDWRQWHYLTSSWMTLAISSGTGELTYTQCDF